MRKSLLLICLILFSHHGFSQEWVELMQDPTVNFYEVQDSFNEYWEGREYEKGKGYKQFKRWEYMMEPRVYPHGERPEPASVYKEYHRFNEKYKNIATSKSNANWTNLGPFGSPGNGSPGVGRINAIAVDPQNPNIVYAGSPAGGLWKSTTGGGNWVPMTDDLPTLGVSGIAIDPIDTDIVYIGTGDGDADDTYSIGVLKSLDGGQTFETTGLNWQLSDFRTVNKLLISPYDNNILLCASNNGLWKTNDAGVTWIQVLAGDVWDVEFHPTDPSIVYATRTSFYRSNDGGDSFDIVQSGTPSAGDVSRLLCAVSPDEPDWVYIMAGASSTQGFLGVYRSTNAGVDFNARSFSPNVMGWTNDGSDTGGQAWYDMAFAVDPQNASRVITGGVNVWASNNAGASWILEAHWVWTGNPSTYVHADIHYLDYFGNTLWCGSDGGVYRSADDGNSWTELNSGLANTQYYRLGVSQTDPGKVMCGAQDNGTHLLENGTWNKMCGGDGMECAINPSNANQLFCSSQYGNIRRSNNGGDDFNGYVGAINETGAWVTPYQIDPNNNNTVVAGFERLWKRVGSSNWTVINSTASSTIDQIEIADADSDVIYFSRGNSVSRTTDGGVSWDFINAGLASLSKTDIDTRPEDALEVYVTTSGYTPGSKIFRSFDGGETWENISLNLPNFPCNTVVCEAGSDGGIYVGMDVGVYYIDNNLTNWVPFDQGIPNVIISELEIQYSSGKLRAATYGRGLWETDLYQPSSLPPTVDFISDENIICVGGEVQFFEQAFNAAPGWTWSFPGGTPSTSTEATPVITYNSPGVYDVTLEMSNGAGTDSETKSMFITVIPYQGESLPFSEGFETFDFDSSLDWTLEDLDSDGVVWEVNSNVGSASSSCLYIDNSVNNDGNRDNVFSKAIDVSTASGLTVSFDAAYAQRSSDNADRLKLFTSGNCGNNWQLNDSWAGNNELASAPETTLPFVPEAGEWNEYEVTNISSSVLTESFRLRFEFQNNGGNNIYLDNININLVSGLEDIDIQNLDLNVYPNPSEDEVHLTFNLLGERDVRIVVTDPLGRVVIQENLGVKGYGTHQHRLDVSDIAAGAYHLQLIVDGKIGARLLRIQ